MKRRKVLATASLSVFPGVSGCIGTLFGCSSPDIDDSLEYENHRVENNSIYKRENVVELLTSPDDIDQELEEAIDEESIEYLTETDFDKFVVIFVRVSSSIGSDELEVQGVGRENENTVRSYTCVPDESGTDDWYPRSQIIRVEHEGQIPEQAVGTHYRERQEETINDRS